MIDLSSACTVHRRALVDFVDRGEVAAATARALAHLDRCGRCTEELEATVLAITALRRLGEDVGRVEPSADAWPRLRTRLERWRPVRSVLTSPVAGMAMSLAIVALLVAPLRIGNGSGPMMTSDSSQASKVEWLAELSYFRTARQAAMPAPAADLAVGSLPRHYPDGIRPAVKEVTSTKPQGRRIGVI